MSDSEVSSDSDNEQNVELRVNEPAQRILRSNGNSNALSQPADVGTILRRQRNNNRNLIMVNNDGREPQDPRRVNANDGNQRQNDQRHVRFANENQNNQANERNINAQAAQMEDLARNMLAPDQNDNNNNDVNANINNNNDNRNNRNVNANANLTN